MNHSIRKINTNLVMNVILLVFGAYLSFILYYIFSQIFYNPINPQYGGGNVFFYPRYFLQQNDMYFTIFEEWIRLIILIPIIASIIYIGLILNTCKLITFKIYLFIIYCFGIALELSFLFISSRDGFEHIALQVHSINNGVYAGLGQMVKKFTDHGVQNLISFESVRVLYSDIYGNLVEGTYPFVGSTHPPGMFVIVAGIYIGAIKILPFFKPEMAIGLIVSLINSLNILLIALILKELFSEKIAKLSALYIIAVPTVLLHYMSIVDGISSVFIGLSILFILYSIKPLLNNHNKINSFCILISGLFLTLAAQFTYGIIIPIISLILSLLIVFYNQSLNIKSILIFFIILFIFPTIYTIFEFYISNGKVSYILMGLERASYVKNGLQNREYPISQIANFIVIFIMGGLVIFPSLLQSFFISIRFIRLLLNGITPSNFGKKGLRNYLALSVCFMVILLISQSTVRLEVERTWHWFFLPAWTLMGYILYGIKIMSRRLFSNSLRSFNFMYLSLCFTQIIISIVLAICVMDYY